ncbi:tetratricopeptide repeat protein [Candidatus Chloroploca sp. Khr17]|uniref:tetratricopeptide repeat protein n=1 Tax=Candidatus Chloroploca sp. Khr17 TaxID=2496869 RepID=UPI00101B822E|nr:tetratricopeptide repeat protein [Candidatus Chloroploca sp. Khr17]
MPDRHQLAILTRLRKAAKVTLAEMARACSLNGNRAYESAGAWERGEAVPRATLRVPFLGYLAQTLRLADDHATLAAIWDVLVQAWGWEPLEEADWRYLKAANTVCMPLQADHMSTRSVFPSLAQMPTAGRLPRPALLPPGSVLPFPPNPHFVGRTAELFALAAHLKGGNAVAVTQVPPTQKHQQIGGETGGQGGNAVAVTQVPPTALVGPGGMGKTQLAIEFAHRFGRFFAGGVFWLSFADPGAVPAAIAACGGSRGLGLRPDFAQLSLDEQVRLVQAAWHAEVPRLVIVDNCEHADLLSRWLPRHGGCRMLITSRHTGWEAGLGLATLQLGLLGRAESMQLLRCYCPTSQLRDEELVAIAAELDDLPLALHLAGSYLARGVDALTPAGYLAELRAALVATGADAIGHPSLAGKGPRGRPLPAPTGHLNHLEQTFALSLARLDPIDPLDRIAYQLVLRAAWFAPGEPIAVELLQATLPAAPAPVTAVLQRLADTGLLLPGAAHVDATIRLHRLVAAFLRRQDGAAEARQAVETALLAHARALNAALDEPALLRLQPHLRAVTDGALQCGDAIAADLSYELSRHLGEVEYYEEATAYNQRSLELRERLFGADDTRLAENLHYAGELLDWLGDYSGARPYHERGLAIRLHSLGPDHRETATSFLHAGEITHALCDYPAARSHYEQALAIRARLFGDDSPAAAELHNNLGLLLNAMGELDAALPYAERTVAIWEAQAQPIRSRQAMAINNLGYLYRTRGAYEAALVHLHRALAIREEVYGPANTFIGVTRNHIGRVYHYQGRLAQAMVELEATLRLFDLAIGREHPITACTLSNVGMLALETGAFADARRMLEEALAIHRRLLGAEHRHVARGLNRLGLMHQTLGEADAARSSLREALAIRRRILGEMHHDTANTLGHLGMLHLTAGRPRQARPMLAEALRRHLARLGEHHPYTARSLLRMGQLSAALGDQLQARAYLNRALLVYTAMLGPAHPSTVAARTLHQAGQPKRPPQSCL